ncbi:MAG TPA: 5-formyltetrahydrofolate cyclo-ligase [Thermoplasmata archaeon]|nr:5-formyltetrahydrofolate cyclo-ligase [Thermoplasmata archaeon]
MKKELRKKILSMRNSMPLADLIDKSNKILLKLKGLKEFQSARTLCAYVSTGSEVRTCELIRYLLGKGQKKIVVPRVNEPRNELDFFTIEKWSQLKPGCYGILEPEGTSRVEPGQIDVFFVPGIVFDERGCRIGYGKGYYDKTLRKTSSAFHVGLAYDFQVLKKIPKEPQDMRVDRIITEKRIMECK